MTDVPITYLYEDDLGFTWIDCSTFIDSNRSGICFMCRTPTNRVEINFGTFYCGSDECEETIRKDLENG